MCLAVMFPTQELIIATKYLKLFLFLNFTLLACQMIL